MYASFRYPFACALPMKAYPSIPTPIRNVVTAARGGHRHEADLALLGHRYRLVRASKATADGVKSERRTNASASCAPHSRSIPASSHSIESGPS